MDTMIVERIVWLICFVVVTRSLWWFYTDSLPKQVLGEEVKKPKQNKAVEQPTPKVESEKKDAPEMESPLHVIHFSDKATLLVRYRRRVSACTAHLIIWAGAKRKKFSDSYYDLGLIEGAELTDQVIEQAMTLANQQLAELAAAGQRKRRQKKTAAEAIQAEAVQVAGKQEEAISSDVVVDETLPESIKLRKFPSVYRGVIKEVGMMKILKDGRELETFGVRYETLEGVVDTVFGVNLRDALKEAKASIGDNVEILKIGRKTITKGKAPMNLYKVAKLAS